MGFIQPLATYRGQDNDGSRALARDIAGAEIVAENKAAAEAFPGAGLPVAGGERWFLPTQPNYDNFQWRFGGKYGTEGRWYRDGEDRGPSAYSIELLTWNGNRELTPAEIDAIKAHECVEAFAPLANLATPKPAHESTDRLEAACDRLTNCLRKFAMLGDGKGLDGCVQRTRVERIISDIECAADSMEIAHAEADSDDKAMHRTAKIEAQIASDACVERDDEESEEDSEGGAA